MNQDPLLQPYRLRDLELKNRVISTAHEPAYSVDGMPRERYVAYHEEKARGGVAMTMIGGSTLVSRDSPPAFGNLDATRDEIIPCFRELADAVHAHGCAVMTQLTHLGRRSSHYGGDWLPLVYPSCVREPAHRAFPKIIEEHDIERIIRDYGEAARRCREGGLDGVELQAYGHLMDGFWSPLTNHRGDDWGGSLENRVRFARRVISEIRQRAGADYILGIRMVFDEQVSGGLGREDGLAIARLLCQDGEVDFAGEIRAELGLPTFHANRINDIATARYAIREGKLDLVGMTRAHMADPHIVRKVSAGDEDRIRPCVGAGYCIDRIYEGGAALCIHNPATGRELELPQVIEPTSGDRSRVVVGAGPAGLEAARVCAERGHEVVVFEASDRAGGQVALAAVPERRRELIGIVDWRLAELERLGVGIRYNTYAEADEVRAESPDIVVIATGGLPNTEFLEQGAEHVETTWDVLGGHFDSDGTVLVYDDNGQNPGVSCAEHLARNGARVELVTPDRQVGQEIGGTNYPAYLRAFYECGVTLTPDRRLQRVEARDGQLHATLRNEFTGAEETRAVAHVIVEHGTLPLDEVYTALKEESTNGGEIDHEALVRTEPQTIERNPDGGFRLYRIGDAVASRNIHAALLDALRLCAAL